MAARRDAVATLLFAALALLAAGTGAVADTSHAGWPRIDGDLKMHKGDQSGPLAATKVSKHNELLGGHGNDVITGGAVGDVLWGDYKPGGQPPTQVDQLVGGGGRDFIYASHGENAIDAGPGSDVVHAHFGRGSIDCGAGRDTLFISHASKPQYRISHCERVSFKTLGY
jgi:Ca2+-binding RTX toxin-like protein